MSVPHCDFPYPPLPIGADSIRVLVVQPADFPEPLICEIISVAFKSKPRYVALSYTWSNPYPDNATIPTRPRVTDHLAYAENVRPDQSTSPPPEVESESLVEANQNNITLNGHHFSIQHNLFLALLHLRSLTHPLTLWVDFICINQSNLQERNSQVAMMSFIYTRASRVVAWLGVPRYRNRIDLFRSMAIDWKAGQGQQFSASVEDATKFRSSLEPDHKVFARLAESAYWTRVWIVQELSLARTLFFLYGSKMWTCEDLQQWKVMRTLKLIPSTPDQIHNDMFKAMLQMLDTRVNRFGEAMRLENLVEAFSKCACSELRDRVYALLGLANDARPYSASSGPEELVGTISRSLHEEAGGSDGSKRMRNWFIVDYDRSFYEIWVDTVTFMSNQKGPIYTDMTRETTIVRTAGIVQHALGQRVDYKICESTLEESMHSANTIKTIGILCTRIIHLGPAYSSLVASFRAQQEWRSSWEEYYPNSHDLEIIREKDNQYAAKILEMSDGDVSMIQEIRSPSAIARHIEDESKQNSSVDGFATQQDVTAGVGLHDKTQDTPRICLGTDRTIALVPSCTVIGDVIVRFWNCSAAIVMRPLPTPSIDIGDRTYVIVGRVDVAGGVSSLMETESESSDWHNPDYEFVTGERMSVEMNYPTLQRISAYIST